LGEVEHWPLPQLDIAHRGRSANDSFSLKFILDAGPPDEKDLRPLQLSRKDNRRTKSWLFADYCEIHGLLVTCAAKGVPPKYQLWQTAGAHVAISHGNGAPIYRRPKYLS
ncbi:unnamed protein product, partial [Sphacelaria rigidula]